MTTYVAENVLEDYTAGLVVIMAETIQEAHVMIDVQFSEGNAKQIKQELRPMTEPEMVFVYGGS